MDNRQAIGYMLLAMKNKGFSKADIKKVYSEMYYLFDVKTEEEAEEQGYEAYYKMQSEAEGY